MAKLQLTFLLGKESQQYFDSDIRQYKETRTQGVKYITSDDGKFSNADGVCEGLSSISNCQIAQKGFWISLISMFLNIIGTKRLPMAGNVVVFKHPFPYHLFIIDS